MKTPETTLYINMQILHLCAVLIDKDPLEMVAFRIYASKEQQKHLLARIERLKGVMPDDMIKQIIELLSALFDRARTNSITFDQSFDRESMNSRNTWLRILSESSFLLDPKAV